MKLDTQRQEALDELAAAIRESTGFGMRLRAARRDVWCAWESLVHDADREAFYAMVVAVDPLARVWLCEDIVNEVAHAMMNPLSERQRAAMWELLRELHRRREESHGRVVPMTYLVHRESFKQACRENGLAAHAHAVGLAQISPAAGGVNDPSFVEVTADALAEVMTFRGDAPDRERAVLLIARAEVIYGRSTCKHEQIFVGQDNVCRACGKNLGEPPS